MKRVGWIGIIIGSALMMTAAIAALKAGMY